jgi:hypothetical protein
MTWHRSSTSALREGPGGPDPSLASLARRVAFREGCGIELAGGAEPELDCPFDLPALHSREIPREMDAVLGPRPLPDHPATAYWWAAEGGANPRLVWPGEGLDMDHFVEQIGHVRPEVSATRF